MRGDFADTYDEQIWTVYGFFAYRVRNREDAEDLTQTTFERALKAWPRFDPGKASARTWLLTIAHNLLVDHYRADRSAQTTSLDEHQEHELGTEPPSPDLGIDHALAQALGRLSHRERVIIALRFGGDLSGREIAEVLDLSVANVQQILSRALRRTRAALDGDPDPGGRATLSAQRPDAGSPQRGDDEEGDARRGERGDSPP
jgi:RNA polymerase sigma-70 factor (ECF subfamily)